jgi:hypothetical protein
MAAHNSLMPAVRYSPHQYIIFPGKMQAQTGYFRTAPAKPPQKQAAYKIFGKISCKACIFAKNKLQ